MGCIKRYLGKTATGEQFLTLEEEKAGIIEKAKQERSREEKAMKRPRSTPDAAASSTRPRDRPEKGSKFKRGRIGESG